MLEPSYPNAARAIESHRLRGLQNISRRLVTPTLVLAGERDQCIAPALFEGLAPAFLGPFDFAVLPGVGHFLPVEAPDEVAARVLAFWEALRAV